MINVTDSRNNSFSLYFLSISLPCSVLAIYKITFCGIILQVQVVAPVFKSGSHFKMTGTSEIPDPDRDFVVWLCQSSKLEFSDIA